MRRPQGAGRKKGTTNKLSGEVAERLRELGCDPIKGMAEIAKSKKTPLELRGRMYSELAQYVWPKRKSVDTFVQQQPERVVYGWSDEIDKAEPVKSSNGGTSDSSESAGGEKHGYYSKAAMQDRRQ
jgi:hypothetical protein